MKLKDSYLKKHPQSKFFCPYDYDPGRLYDLKGTRPVLRERDLALPSNLLPAKERLPPWLWKACKAILDRIPSLPHSAHSSRAAAMNSACAFFLDRPEPYPSRPETRKFGVIRVTILRDELAKIPRTPYRNTDEWGRGAKGLRFVSVGEKAADGYYEWDDTVIERVCQKLCSIIGNNDLGVSAWESMRWEVYDKVCRIAVSSSVSPHLTSTLFAVFHLPWPRHLV